MEKKKKRDKPSLNNTTETEAPDNQQKEGEIQGGVTVAKRFYRVESPMQENATGVHHQSPQILQWPYTPQVQSEQSLQFPAHSSQAQQPHPLARHQPQHQHQQQQQVLHGHQGALPQGQPQLQQQAQPQPQPQQQSVPYWPLTEYPAIAPPPGPFYPFPPGSNESNWQTTGFTGAHPANDHAAPYGYQGGYAYPVGYPGPWDPAAWWAHSHHQAPYPYPYPPFSGGYGYMAPPVPPAAGIAPSGTYQRGIIRPPTGLSQKHQRLWEAQSMENVQLWSALARAESEIAAYRGRLMKLESDLFAVKAHHDAAVEGSPVVNTVPQNARKGRNKRATVVTTSALPSSDNVQPRSRGRKVAAYKMVIEEKEKNDGDEKESKLEEKEKINAPVTVAPQSIPAPEEEREKVAPVLINANDFELEKNKSRLSSDFPTAVICPNHVFSSDTDNLQYNTINQMSTFGTSLPLTGRKENGNEHPTERKSPLVGSTQNLNFMESKASESGEDGSASYRSVNNRVNGWPAPPPAGDSVRNMMLEGRMHTFYDHGTTMRSDQVRSGKLLSPWGYVCEDASEEQDDVVPSGKEEDDEEMDEDADSALDEVRRQKGENILRLDSTSGIPKSLTPMNRW
ncbi:hypothetical protein SUGI_0604570 [Cryptomeria japonica]|uniref:uncharacterized protein LOC131076990 n=1 Tax=Cryptomeria japonica TaxID=3369 RepID=UPI0024147139|nr:uncharacterized protein LOC131076990 [Cryptomeria japonica]GLJ30539.1 hypothetical protein SUGI_0604570 [Cryptomeria japonica]